MVIAYTSDQYHLTGVIPESDAVFLRACKKNGADVIAFNPAEVHIITGEEISLRYAGYELSQVDLFFAGSIKQISFQLQKIVSVMERQGVVLLDSMDAFFFQEMQWFYHQSLSQNRRIPKTIHLAQTTRLSLQLAQEEGLQFPFVLKPIQSQTTKHIRVVNNATEFLRFPNRDQERGVIAQAYIPSVVEYEVLILQGKSLGVLQKESKKDGCYYMRNREIELIAEEATAQLPGFLLQVQLLQTIDGALHLIDICRATSQNLFQSTSKIDIPDRFVKAAFAEYHRVSGLQRGQ